MLPSWLRQGSAALLAINSYVRRPHKRRAWTLAEGTATISLVQLRFGHSDAACYVDTGAWVAINGLGGERDSQNEKGHAAKRGTRSHFMLCNL